MQDLSDIVVISGGLFVFGGVILIDPDGSIREMTMYTCSVPVHNTW